MARDANLWDPDSEPIGAPVDDATFDNFETTYDVTLPNPKSFKALYRFQNGGGLQDVEWPNFLMPLGTTAEPDFEHISPVGWQCSESGMQPDDLDWVEGEFGDMSRMFTLYSDGHVYFALDYNKRNRAGEPRIICLDFEGPDGEVIAPSFQAWIKQLTASESEGAVDWDEHRQYSELFRETIVSEFDGKPLETEYVLCRDDVQGLVVFHRVQSEGHVLEIERAELPNGVSSLWLVVNPCREEPVQTFMLVLQPLDDADIHWVSSERTKKGNWKNERSQGVPVYAEVESQSEARLHKLAKTLRDAGLVHEPEPFKMPDLEIPGLPPGYAADLMRNLQNMLKQQFNRPPDSRPEDDD
jgi:hypothetical protein